MHIEHGQLILVMVFAAGVDVPRVFDYHTNLFSTEGIITTLLDSWMMDGVSFYLG